MDRTARLKVKGPSEWADSADDERRRRLGAYYTSEPVARLLVQWAIRSADTRVMDPAYGGCAFLRESIDRLRELGAASATDQVFGADIDETTAEWRAHLVSSGVPSLNLQHGDFLRMTPDKELPRCAAIVGNPPYIRHHLLTAEQMSEYSEIRRTGSMSARASTWAYFVVHSLEFLQPGGRMAILLPGAVLHDGGYAEQVRAVLARACQTVGLVRVRDRLFPEVKEETVVLLAIAHPLLQPLEPAPRGGARGDAEFHEVDDLAALADLLATWPSVVHAKPPVDRRRQERSIPNDVLDLLDRCRDRLSRVDEVADVRIGVVTGSNEFFVRSPSTWPSDRAAEWVAVVSRGSWLDTPLWTGSDIARHEDRDDRMRLLLINSDEWSSEKRGALSKLVAQAEVDGVHLSSHARRREPWFDLVNVPVPDAFLPYMGQIAGRMVVNVGRATSTNAIHHISWKDHPTGDLALARALSTWSSVWQLCGELEGRSYGGGVLKLEPGVARGLPLWNDDVCDRRIKAILEFARRACASKDPKTIRLAANELVRNATGISKSGLELVAETANRLALARRGANVGSR